MNGNYIETGERKANSEQNEWIVNGFGGGATLSMVNLFFVLVCVSE